MAAFHYDSKNEPAESMESVDGKISLVGNINNPATLYSKGPDEVQRRGVARTSTPAFRWSGRSARSRCRRRSRACAHPRGRSRVARPSSSRPRRERMPELSDVTNDFIRGEIEEFVERARRARAADRPLRRARPPTAGIAAALIDGDDDTVDELTRSALDDGAHGARGDGRRPDRRDGRSSASSSARTSSSCPRCSPAPGR